MDRTHLRTNVFGLPAGGQLVSDVGPSLKLNHPSTAKGLVIRKKKLFERVTLPKILKKFSTDIGYPLDMSYPSSCSDLECVGEESDGCVPTGTMSMQFLVALVICMKPVSLI